GIAFGRGNIQNASAGFDEAEASAADFACDRGKCGVINLEGAVGKCAGAVIAVKRVRPGKREGVCAADDEGLIVGGAGILEWIRDGARTAGGENRTVAGRAGKFRSDEQGTSTDRAGSDSAGRRNGISAKSNRAG